MYIKGGFIQWTRSVLTNLVLEVRVRMISLRLWILQRRLRQRKKRRKLIDLVFSQALEGVGTKYGRIQWGLIYVYSLSGYALAIRFLDEGYLGLYLRAVLQFY
jgi:hypothetical protein